MSEDMRPCRLLGEPGGGNVQGPTSGVFLFLEILLVEGSLPLEGGGKTLPDTLLEPAARAVLVDGGIHRAAGPHLEQRRMLSLW